MVKIFIILLLLVIVGAVIIKIISNNRDVSVIDKEKIISKNNTLECTVFDGIEIKGNATISIENGKFSNEIIFNQNSSDDSKFFLMPGLIDAHTHITNEKQIEEMINNGVTTAYDVAASKKIANSSENFNMWTATTTIMPGISNGRATVNNLIAQGADYVKVMVDMPAIMGGGLIEKDILQDMVNCAHENNLKVAGHVTTVDAVKQAVDAGVDILIHVPIGEKFPEELAKEIASKNIAVIPTLVMMQSFANSKIYGFEESDYQDAENAVKLLNSYGVPILVGTDANSSFFVPDIQHGSSLHKEMELLVKAGLTPLEVLQGATTKSVNAFGLEENSKKQIYKSIMVLVEGRPDQNITDTTKIRQIWIDGEPVFDVQEENSNFQNENIKGENIMNNEELIFIPKHPSDWKTMQIETKDSTLLEQKEPINSLELYNLFCNEIDNALKIYEDKRFEVTGIAIKVGPDIHNKPSIEISNEVDGRCHILCVFPSDEVYNKVSVGDKVVCKGNYLVMSNWYGIVMKKCELVN